jgi:hypothetical protein
MPTRSGCDFHEISPTHFVCQYCYESAPVAFMFQGMVKKRVRILLESDDGDEWVGLPDSFTEIWTDPHCLACHRQVLGYAPLHPQSTHGRLVSIFCGRSRYKYV